MHTFSFIPKTNPKKPFPLDFETFPPTPNHNPIISADPVTTFTEVHGVLKLLLHIAIYSEHAQLHLSIAETRGVMALIDCAASALEYELDYRPADDGHDFTEQAATHRLGQGLDEAEQRSAHALLERLLAELGYGLYSRSSQPDTNADGENTETT